MSSYSDLRRRRYSLADLGQILGDLILSQPVTDERLCAAGSSFISTLPLERIFIEYGLLKQRIVFHKLLPKKSQERMTFREIDVADFEKIISYVGGKGALINGVEYAVLNSMPGILCILKTNIKGTTNVEVSTLFLEFDQKNAGNFIEEIPSGLGSEMVKAVIDSNDIQVICRLLHTLITFWEKLYVNFSPRVSQRYLEYQIYSSIEQSSRARGDDTQFECMVPPWLRANGKGLARTCTLSLDLRRSTFAMSHADIATSYARWIEAFVLILKRVASDNFGVFDKFTGDGVIVHFLAIECHEMTDESYRSHGVKVPDGACAVRFAVKCAWEMITTLGFHMRSLDRILKLPNAGLGPAVGLAIDEACWAVDQFGNPIVVGTGVVHACRAADSTPANRVRMTGITKTQLTQALGKSVAAVKKPFITKEYGESAGVQIWEMNQPPAELCRATSELKETCQDIYNDMKQGISPDLDLTWLSI